MQVARQPRGSRAAALAVAVVVTVVVLIVIVLVRRDRFPPGSEHEATAVAAQTSGCSNTRWTVELGDHRWTNEDLRYGRTPPVDIPTGPAPLGWNPAGQPGVLRVLDDTYAVFTSTGGAIALRGGAERRFSTMPCSVEGGR